MISDIYNDRTVRIYENIRSTVRAQTVFDSVDSSTTTNRVRLSVVETVNEFCPFTRTKTIRFTHRSIRSSRPKTEIRTNVSRYCVLFRKKWP